MTDITRDATTFSKLGVQFLGLGYCAEQNTDGICPVSCTAVCYVTVITLFIKKVGVVRSIFFFGGGRGPDPRTPVVAPLDITDVIIRIHCRPTMGVLLHVKEEGN